MTDELSASGKKQFKGANFPMTEDGRLYHLGVKKGELSNRLILVGDLGRCLRISNQFLDDPEKTRCRILRYKSSRGFLSITGKYKGVPVSIMGTGMGIPMMDFAVRESRAIIDGEIAAIRIGTCGTPDENIQLGNIVVSDSSVIVLRNPDAWRKKLKNKNLPHYILSEPAYPDEELFKNLKTNIESEIGDKKSVHQGLNASADSFYSSQGRIIGHFNDNNENLIDGQFLKKYPNMKSIEMESFHLLDLAECSDGVIKAANAAIVLAQRKEGSFIDTNLKLKRELQCGKAALETLISYKIKGEMKGKECVWDKENKFQTKLNIEIDQNSIGVPTSFIPVRK